MDQLIKIVTLCKEVGIKTASELYEFKQKYNCKSNEDTIRALIETLNQVNEREKCYGKRK